MTEKKTLRKFWGWGDVGQGLDANEQEALRQRYAAGYGVEMRGPAAPRAEEIPLRAPRLQPPASLRSITTTDPWERLVHAYGRSYPDIVRIFHRQVPEPPDVIAYPETEAQVIELLDWADSAGAAAIPYGRGSSVVGGVEPAVGDSYRGSITIDLERMNKVLEVDRVSRAARIQAGARGPELEAQLKPHGYTLRHFPQSFEHSTLGGWIVTRSGGHFATLYTHIDDFVESTRMVTPRGVMETRRLPGSGAGPSPDRLVLGSEGILGILTEAWMRLQDVPRFRGSRAVRFDSMMAGAAAVRALTQAGLYPANCRLLDAEEAASAGASDGTHATMVLGFESADHPVDAWMTRALELVRDHGGRYQTAEEEAAVAGGGASHRGGAVGAWRDAFLRAPFYREVTVPWGVVGETFESACTWDRFAEFHDGIKAAMQKVLREVTGRPGRITCRFTHAYPDGPAPYFSYQALGTFDGALAQWREIKQAANEAVIAHGGTITHHHAVGRDHRPGYEKETPALFLAALAAAKKAVDPNGIMNPGVLIDPIGRSVGVTGALRTS
jgi:alkyldihydroxyacetonephosphate synthase